MEAKTPNRALRRVLLDFEAKRLWEDEVIEGCGGRVLLQLPGRKRALLWLRPCEELGGAPRCDVDLLLGRDALDCVLFRETVPLDAQPRDWEWEACVCGVRWPWMWSHGAGELKQVKAAPTCGECDAVLEPELWTSGRRGVRPFVGQREQDFIAMVLTELLRAKESGDLHRVRDAAAEGADALLLQITAKGDCAELDFVPAKSWRMPPPRPIPVPADAAQWLRRGGTMRVGIFALWDVGEPRGTDPYCVLLTERPAERSSKRVAGDHSGVLAALGWIREEPDDLPRRQRVFHGLDFGRAAEELFAMLRQPETGGLDLPFGLPERLVFSSPGLYARVAPGLRSLGVDCLLRGGDTLLRSAAVGLFDECMSDGAARIFAELGEAPRPGQQGASGACF